MASSLATAFLKELATRWGRPERLPKSQSLFEVAGRVRVYLRYSRVHENGKTFFGLRQTDLMQLEALPSFICFLWDGQPAPLLVPYEEFSDVFASISPGSDGQYKVHGEPRPDGTVLRIIRAGCFGVDSYFGKDRLIQAVEAQGLVEPIPDFSHSQVQSLLGAIGDRSGYSIWTPLADRQLLDLQLSGPFKLVDTLPQIGSSLLRAIVQQIDVLWLDPERNTITAAFEVEHSTPIYSGLLRFNDVHIDFKLPRAAVVAQQERRSVFVRQVNRRTFQASGLSEVCVFYEYADVYKWFLRLRSARSAPV